VTWPRIYQLLACRRGRHRDAHVMADELIGSELAFEYPKVAICEVCGRAVDWPNGTPTLHGQEPSSRLSQISATALACLVGTPARWLLLGVVVQVKAEPAGEFFEADRDAGLAGAHAVKQGGLRGVGGRLLPLASEQVVHPRGRLIQRCCHGAMIPHGGVRTATGPRGSAPPPSC
jgi:hypothetical protein